MNLLQLTDIKKTYNQGNNSYIALNGITLSVSKGEFVMIVGASGSGKSTLLHLIGGVDVPTSGTVNFNGENIFLKNQEELAYYRRKNVSIIYQNYNLISLLTVEENIAFPSMIDGNEIDKEKILDIAKQLKIDDVLNKFPNQLSGGQQQRASVARAMYMNADIILADEPTGNLDVANTAEVMKLFRKANKQNHQTIIMITHNRELTEFADRVIILQDGTIIKDEAKL